jgi:hypothetical protein
MKEIFLFYSLIPTFSQREKGRNALVLYRKAPSASDVISRSNAILADAAKCSQFSCRGNSGNAISTDFLQRFRRGLEQLGCQFELSRQWRYSRDLPGFSCDARQ